MILCGICDIRRNAMLDRQSSATDMLVPSYEEDGYFMCYANAGEYVEACRYCPYCGNPAPITAKVK